MCNKIPPSHFLELCIYQRSLSLLMSVSNFLWHTHFEELFNFLLNWEEGKSQGKSNKSFSSATNYCWPTTFFSVVSVGNINSISEFSFILTNERITMGKKKKIVSFEFFIHHKSWLWTSILYYKSIEPTNILGPKYSIFYWFKKIAKKFKKFFGFIN